MNKRFYKKGEFIYLKNLKKKGRVKEIDKNNKQLTATYFNEEGNLVEDTFKFWEVDKFKIKDEIWFAKLREDAKIPSKRFEDGCYDIYACFDEDYIEIKPGEIYKVPTGIVSAFSPKYRINIRERGSTGTKGLARRSSQIDSGYRNEWFFPINNTTNKSIFIEKGIKEKYEDKQGFHYPYSKAIGQAAVEFVPDVFVKEKSYDEVMNIPSERGKGREGSSGK